MIVRLCRYPGCYQPATIGRYCDEHQPTSQPRAKQAKPWAGAQRPNDPLYNTSQWRALRAQVIREQGQCYFCGSVVNLTVHHIRSPKGDPDLFFDRDNLVVVCKPCHDRLTSREARR